MSKYHAVKTEVDGIMFASKAEARRYGELKLLVKAKEIYSLVLQPEYLITVDGKKIAKYIADFRYHLGEDEIIEDVKGIRTPVYKLKKRLVEAQYGIKITEVK